MSEKRIIYFDNAATTKVYPEVVEAMLPYFTQHYGNPSSVYSFSQRVKNDETAARDLIADTIGAKSNEIYFTAGGTESDNWALKASAEFYKDKGKHIITSTIEHHAILHTCEYLEKQGFEITYLPVNEEGRVNPEDVREAIRPDTILISIMFANNEIGTIQPIAEIGKIAKEKGVLFHTDAVQAYAHIPIDVNAMNIDMLSASGHKFGGPKGIGFLYIRTGVKIRSFIHGGSQERKRRAGTDNIPGIIGMAKAAQISVSNMQKFAKHEMELRDYLIERLRKEFEHVKINGSLQERLPNNVNVCFRFIEGEGMLILLDNAGICASSGSACTSGSLDPSHVLLAIGLPHEKAHGSLRISLSPENTKEEIDILVEELKKIIERLRSMSPLYEDYLKKHPKN